MIYRNGSLLYGDILAVVDDITLVRETVRGLFLYNSEHLLERSVRYID